MHAFVANQDIFINFGKFRRAYSGTELSGEVNIEQIYVDTGGESKAVRDALRARDKASYTDDSPAPDYVQAIGEGALIQFAQCPPRLGRATAKLFNNELRQIDDPDTLRQQLERLVELKPGKRHFRIALVNSFGTNLGDCVIGMTALRCVSKVLAEYLPSFVFDAFTGPNSNQSNFNIIANDPLIGMARFSSPSLKEFANYDAYLDFTGLIALPRFNQMPIVDWYIWWMGLDPSQFAEDQKTNIVPLEQQALRSITAEVHNLKAERKILFNHKASVPLRSMTDAAAIELLKKLISLDKKAHFLLSSDLKFKHPRVHPFLDKTRQDINLFNGLMAQVDGVITVDTYLIHLANALGKPVVGLYASIKPDAYPYYPSHEGLLIPGGEDLPAFGQSKVGDDDEWAKISKDYDRAWSALEAKTVYDALRSAEQKAAQLGVRPWYFIDPHRAHRVTMSSEDGTQLRYDYPSAAWTSALDKFKQLANQMASPGGRSWLMCPGQSGLVLLLARKVGLEGELSIFEPRTLRRQIILNDLLQRYPQVKINAFNTLPIAIEKYELPCEDPLGQVSPDAWGNNNVNETYYPIDQKKNPLPRPEIIFMVSPTPFTQVLPAIETTLAEFKPLVVLGPFSSLETMRPVAQSFGALNFETWVTELATDPAAFMMLAKHEDNRLNIQGMKKVVLS